ncbi:MAG: hypothetical protein ACI9WT_000089 [Flavobacterium sp.]|jgi:hypothetical protein
MKNQQVFKLIDGVFTSEEAGSVLTTLINSKIDYHNLEDFSSQIRFNKDVSNSKNRLQELNETKEEIKKLLGAAEVKGLNLVIKSTIEISFE